VEEAVVSPLPTKGRREAEALVPGEDCVDRVLEHGQRGFEG
jgi:hypothetical protein